MSILSGTLYLTDSVDFISRSIYDGRKHLIFDMDDQSDDLERMFPDIALKTTVLLPPPSAIFKQIDGESQEFIMEYKSYLYTKEIGDIISLIVIALYHGFDCLLYIPSYSEDSIWVNVLLEFFESAFGIHIGTSAQNFFSFNEMHHGDIVTILYLENIIDVDMYMRWLPPSVVLFPQHVLVKLHADMLKYAGIDEDYMAAFNRMRALYHQSPTSVPAITFE